MCSKTTRSSPRTRSSRKRKPKPPRKTRSLQDFSPPSMDSPELPELPASPESPESPGSPESPESTRQLNLFPLHPETQSFEEEKEDNNVEYLFDTTDTKNVTLNGLLWSAEGRGSAVSSEEADSLCPTLTYTYRGHDSEEITTTTSSLLERSAMRGGNKERDLSEERWVCYEEVTSCVPELRNQIKIEPDVGVGVGGGGLLLALKLDYDEIMNAWSDKGPLYIDGGGCSDGSQIVPDVLDDAFRQDITQGFFDGGNVPQMEGTEGEVWKMRTREARVLRYKEKRQNRLFAKRIRYEVRKLNAEKRPRMKGRFVKRS